MSIPFTKNISMHNMLCIVVGNLALLLQAVKQTFQKTSIQTAWALQYIAVKYNPSATNSLSCLGAILDVHTCLKHIFKKNDSLTFLTFCESKVHNGFLVLSSGSCLIDWLVFPKRLFMLILCKNIHL